MMDSIIDIARIADPATNPLSSGTLQRSIEQFAYAAFGAQANGLVVSRQPPVPALDDMTRGLQALQEKLRQHAAYVTQTLIPGALTSLTDTDAAVNLFTAMRNEVHSILAKGTAAELQAAKLVGLVRDEYETSATNANETAGTWKREADALDELVGTLKADVAKTIQALDGPDGLLRTTEAAIETVIEQLAADVDAAVKSGQQIGDGIKSLMTGIVTSISGLFGGGDDDKKKTDPSDPDKNKSDAKKDDPDAPDDAKAKPDAKPVIANTTAGGTDSVSVEGIAAIEQGAGGASQVTANFRAHYKKLAELYQALAEAKATLAATRAVQSQAALLAGAVKDGAAAAAANHNSWAAIATGFADYARETAPPNTISPTLVLAMLNAAYTQGWSRLPNRIRPIEAAFAGIGNAIPPGGALT